MLLNEFNINSTMPYHILSAPAVSFGILIYPLMDTLRVFAIRIVQKKSPFSADKNHTHHRLLALGMNHRGATYTILFVNLLFTVAVFYFQWLGIFGLMAFNLVVCGILMLVPSFLAAIKRSISKDDPYQKIIFFDNPYFLNYLERRTPGTENYTIPLKRLKEQLQRISFW